jgi:eukaryotic translation initiation factor 2C
MQRGTDRGRGRGGPERGRPFRGGPGGRGTPRGPAPGGRGRGGSFAPREQGGYVSRLALPSSPLIFCATPYSRHASIFAEGQPANIDARLADSAEDRLILSFKSLSLRQDAMPPRPDYGTKGWYSSRLYGLVRHDVYSGKSIKLRTNYFPICVPKGPLHEYDISISPSQGVSNRRVKRRIFQLAENTQDWAANGLKGRVAHDSSAKLIAADVLPQPLSITVPYYEEDDDHGDSDRGRKEYVLTINYIQPLETDGLQQ